MPLVKSTSDGAFVEEVRVEMEDARGREIAHTTAMIEEYLSLREKQFEEEIRHQVACQEEKAQQEREAQAQESAKVLLRLSKTQEKLARAIDLRQSWRTRSMQRHYFSCWRQICREQRVKHEKSAQQAFMLARLASYHYFLQWRLFVVGSRACRLEARRASAYRARENDVMEQLNSVLRALEEEKRRNRELDEQLREAFLRGVSALNREAINALRGEKPSEDDIAVIEELISGGAGKPNALTATEPGRKKNAVETAAGGSHSVENPRAKKEEFNSAPSSMSSLSSPLGVCPVHRLDKDRNFYHRCYAPSACAYLPSSQRSTTVTKARETSTNTPFFVRVDSKEIPSYNAAPSVKTILTKKVGRRS